MPKRRRRLVIVANRLPVHRVRRGRDSGWESSNGGLVTALAPILREGLSSGGAGDAGGGGGSKGRAGARRGSKDAGTWVGWTGIAGKSTRPFVHDGLRIRPVPISDHEVDSYYNHISNRTLWPLYHDAIRTPEFDHTHWRPYVEVNQRFAKAASQVAERGDLVWVHDYHLQLVPRMLRQMRPDLRIGWFLHIPFPPEELFAWLPWREQILQGILGADLIGFQTPAAAQNFARAAREFGGAEGSVASLTVGKKSVAVDAFPVSIDFEWFQSQASKPSTIAAASQIRKRIGEHRKLLLAVDRLDYTKGIDLRLRAFETLLRSKKVKVEDCVLMQVATPSREAAMEYAEMRTRIEQLVGRINGEFSSPGRVAVHYFRRNLTREELTAYYRAADVMLVTPVRDGMNLVAKEYIATRTDHSGVLVLSEFAGAAQQLGRALLVNPRDVEGMARTIHEAIMMPKSEMHERMAVLRTLVRRHDVYGWAQSFLEALAG